MNKDEKVNAWKVSYQQHKIGLVVLSTGQNSWRMKISKSKENYNLGMNAMKKMPENKFLIYQ